MATAEVPAEAEGRPMAAERPTGAEEAPKGAAEPGAPPPALLRRLLDEHQEILPALQQWADSLATAEPGAARRRLAALAERLRLHARIEDETLFEAMRELLGRAALTGYEMQHDDIDDVLESLLAVPDALPDDTAELAGRLLWYCESHFEIEEKHIFQEALRRLTPEQWADLYARAAALTPPNAARPPLEVNEEPQEQP